jgi:hypothetical protein
MNLSPLPPEVPAAPENDAASELAQITAMRNYRIAAGGLSGAGLPPRGPGEHAPQLQILRGEFHRHTEISPDGINDGLLEDGYRYFINAANMDWGKGFDHDNGGGHEYTWWLCQKFTDAYFMAGRYTAMFGYERSVDFPEGHRNVMFQRRGIRPLNRMTLGLPAAANDTIMLYNYLRQFGGLTASHTSGTSGMGTDWRNNDPKLEPIVEIYQGDRQSYEIPGAIRAISATDAVAGFQPLGWVSLALQKGYVLGFEASSDHNSTHMSYSNIYAAEPTRAALLAGLQARHVYGATDNILADVRCGAHMMGDQFPTGGAPVIDVKLVGTANFANVFIIKDGTVAYSLQPNTSTVSFSWQDPSLASGHTSIYYVRGEQTPITLNGAQTAGEVVWTSPMWITRQ